MIPIYLQDIFNFYTADWTMLQRDNKEYSRYPRFKRGEASRFEKKTIAPQKFEVDLSGEANFILHSEFLDLFCIHFFFFLFLLFSSSFLSFLFFLGVQTTPVLR